MKKMALIGCLACVLFMPGCTSVDAAKLVARWAGVSQTTINRVQDGTIRLCSFLPDAKTVTAIFKTGKYRQIAEDIDSVISSVCNAVVINPKAEGPGGRRAPSVAGVRIKGKFVRR